MCLAIVALSGRLISYSPAMRFCRGALPSRTRRCVSVAALCPRAPGDAFLPRRFALGSRLLFAAWRQTGRLAVACVSIPPGRERHLCVLAVSVRLSAFVGLLRVWPFLYGDLDGVPGTRGRGWRRGACASLRKRIGTVMLSAGSTLGLNMEAALRPPQTAPKSQKWKPHCGLSGLSSGADRVAKCVLHGLSGLLIPNCPSPPSPGYTERPARL